LGFFKEICSITTDDGVTFDTDSLVVDTARDESGYSGLRLLTAQEFASSSISVMVMQPSPVSTRSN
jgi:hypothetical protein